MATLVACDRYAKWLVFLQPIEPIWGILDKPPSLLAWGIAASFLVVPWVWRWGLRLEQPAPRRAIPWAALLAVGLLLVLQGFLATPRGRWFFVEWAKVRTANPSFARNTLFWEQRRFPESGSKNPHTRVGLVGSSQTFQGFDLEVLQGATEGMRFEKNCLAGMGPMHYAMLTGRILARRHDVVICHLSEFDFYREDDLPLERLRWASSPEGFSLLTSCMDTRMIVAERAVLGDLSVAAALPMWRYRDHVRRTAFGYWWDARQPAEMALSQTQLADSPDLEQAMTFLRRNIGAKRMVPVNFAAFAAFAERLRQAKVRLVVLEGAVHPRARRAYDTGHWQEATRQQLRGLSEALAFEYVAAERQPHFGEEDFADAYHLNPRGRERLSSFLGRYLQAP